MARCGQAASVFVRHRTWDNEASAYTLWANEHRYDVAMGAIEVTENRCE